MCVKVSGHPYMLANTCRRSTLLKLLLQGTLSGVAYHPPLPSWHALHILKFWSAYLITQSNCAQRLAWGRGVCLAAATGT
jgi:hypothetical protein